MFGAETREWPDEDRCDLPMLLCDDTVITAALVRRSAVVAMGGFDEQMPSQGDEDWALWLALVESGHLGTILPDVLFYYRRRPNSMCLECTQGDTHLRLVEYLVKKHEGSYRRHLEDVLLWKEARIGALRRHNMAAEADLAIVLRPAVARRRAELDQLRRGSRSRGPGSGPAASTTFEALRAEYTKSQAEVRALRASVSWRLTAPLRGVCDGLRRLIGRRT